MPHANACAYRWCVSHCLTRSRLTPGNGSASEFFFALLAFSTAQRNRCSPFHVHGHTHAHSLKHTRTPPPPHTHTSFDTVNSTCSSGRRRRCRRCAKRWSERPRNKTMRVRVCCRFPSRSVLEILPVAPRRFVFKRMQAIQPPASTLLHVTVKVQWHTRTHKNTPSHVARLKAQ